MSAAAAAGNASATFADFCHRCGAVMPLLNRGALLLTCARCGFQLNVSTLDGTTRETVIVFNRWDPVTKRRVETSTKIGGEKTADGKEKMMAPVVARKCPKCPSEEMMFTTRQTRSADEGQTVFYTCVDCGFQENENS